MNFNRISLGIIFFCIFSQSHAQSSFPEKLLSSSGPVPKDFHESYTSRLEKRISQIEGNNRLSRDETEYYEQTEYSILRMLQNGSVYYGDEVSLYVSEIVDILLKNHPQLRSELRVYTLKKTNFNASVTANGIILVNTGLVAQLQNEAELAALLAHEIAHYAAKHSKEKFMEYVNLNKSTWVFDLETREENFQSMLDYSKSKEFEADKSGYNEYFKNSGYRRGAALDLFDVMLYSYLPFDEEKFDASLFEIPGFPLPNQCKLSEVNAVTAYEDWDDEKSTHPNIKSRKKEMLGLVDEPKKGQNYLVSEERFLHVRNLCRIENTRIYLKERNPARAIYNTFLLLQNYPENQFLEKHLIHAIYIASLYKNYFKLPDIVKDYDDIEGHSQEVYYILTNMEAEALNVIVLRKAYEYVKRHPEDKVMKKVFEDAVWELTFIHNKNLSDFKDLPDTTELDTLANEIPEEVEEASGKLSKVARLKKQKEGTVEDFDIRYALTGLLDDKLLKETFAEKAKEKERRKEDLPYRGDDDDNREFITWKDLRDPSSHYNRFRKKYTLPEKNEKNKGGLGIDSVIVLTPMYIKVNPMTTHKILPFSSNKSLNEFSDYMDNTANIAGIYTQKFDYFSMNRSSDADETYFSEIQILQEWLNEIAGHKNIELVPATAHLVDDIVEKYNIRHLVFSGIFASKFMDKTIQINMATIISPFVNPLSLPYQVMYSLDRSFRNINFFITYDLLTGRVVHSNIIRTGSTNQSMLKGKLYDDFLFLKTPKL